MPHRTVVLTILDGWGLREEAEGNAPLLAKTPNFDGLMRTCPHATLSASGADVGLPDGQMGNSEVGHTNIGAGRVVKMDLPKIDDAIEDGSFFANPALVTFMARMKETRGTVHLMGLLSPGGVHSHQRHITALAMALSQAGIPVKIHAFLDGRDVGPKTGRDVMFQLLSDLTEMKDVRVATICGRFFAMDRDNRWDRVAKAYRLMVEGVGTQYRGALSAIEASYRRSVTDEFVEPIVVGSYHGMQPGDGLLMANFRADRARELLTALTAPEFDAFERSVRPSFGATLGMVSYSDQLDRSIPAMYPPEEIVNTLGEWLAAHGKRQLRVAETEKYPHVTFFLNGGIEDPDAGEERFMAPSPNVRTYDLAPAMSAAEVTERVVAGIHEGVDCIVVNYANPDMVGHTGSLPAAIEACEAVDTGLGQVIEALDQAGGAMIVTADHGNCDMMIDPKNGGPHTAHTTNPVPVILVERGDGSLNAGIAPNGRLADLAPSLLALMGMEQPVEMTGRSLLTGV